RTVTVSVGQRGGISECRAASDAIRESVAVADGARMRCGIGSGSRCARDEIVGVAGQLLGRVDDVSEVPLRDTGYISARRERGVVSSVVLGSRGRQRRESCRIVVGVSNLALPTSDIGEVYF